MPLVGLPVSLLDPAFSAMWAWATSGLVMCDVGWMCRGWNVEAANAGRQSTTFVTRKEAADRVRSPSGDTAYESTERQEPPF